MIEKREIVGQWWLPSRPEEKYIGTHLAQALEAFHATKYGKASFAERVTALTTPHLANLTGLEQNAGSFGEEVRDNRNYYTHHDPTIQARGRVLSGSQLLRLNEKIRLVFQMCILSEMGIPEERFAILRRQIATWMVDYF